MASRDFLACAFLIGVLFVTKSDAQNCSELKNITRSRDSIIVNTRQSRLCIQCLNNGVPLAGAVTWTGQGGPQNNFLLSQNEVPAGLEYVNGVLVFLEPMMFIQDGIDDELRVTCGDETIRFDDSEIISNFFLPGQILQSSPLIVNESDSVLLECEENNPGALESNPEPPQGWFDINGNPFGNTVRRNLRLPNITRNQAGNYTCFTRDKSKTFFNTSIEVIVQYAPEVNSSSRTNDTVFLGGTLTLSCIFVGVPTPTVTWMHNDLVLNASDPEISITTTETTSQLVRTNINGDGGGIYRCITTNLLGSVTANVSRLVLFPPDPASNLNVVSNERRMTVTFDTNFDGNSPFTAVSVEYFPVGMESALRFVSVSTTNPTDVTLTGLMPFTNYTIRVILINLVGRSNSTSTIAQTLSLRLGPPMITNFTAVSSTVLDLTWAPPAPLATTDAPTMWKIEFFLKDAMTPIMANMTEAATTQIRYEGLEKGTMYRARVAGINVRGTGDFSTMSSTQTDVDPPSEPLAVSVTDGMTSFSLMVSWMPPLENGGRPVSAYQITVFEVFNDSAAIFSANVSANNRSFLIRDTNMTVLMGSTTYVVNVAAGNEADFGRPASDTGTTLSIELPQPILDEPMLLYVQNISAIVTWVNPGGTVNEYVVRYRQLGSDGSTEVNVSNRTINGTQQMVQLDNLRPATSYVVEVLTVNDNGTSPASPQLHIRTNNPPNPVIEGPPPPVTEGEEAVLTCFSPLMALGSDITWFFNGSSNLPPSFNVSENNLIISNVRLEHEGFYNCTIEGTTKSFFLDVRSRNNVPGGISQTTIIIAAAVGGGGGLIIIILIILIIVCCCCYRKNDDRGNYKPRKTSAMRVDKRTNDLFEVSNTYVPLSRNKEGDTTAAESGVTFNMPESYQAHSSFNTLDKPSKSESPELAEPTSFGGKRSSKEGMMGGDSSIPPSGGYQDMPPTTDGTML